MDVVLEVYIFHGSVIFDESKVLTIGGLCKYVCENIIENYSHNVQL